MQPIGNTGRKKQKKRTETATYSWNKKHFIEKWSKLGPKVMKEHWLPHRTEFITFWKIPGVSCIPKAATNIQSTKYSNDETVGHCQTCLMTSGSNVYQLLQYNLSLKCFKSHECIAVLVFFSPFLYICCHLAIFLIYISVLSPVF